MGDAYPLANEKYILAEWYSVMWYEKFDDIKAFMQELKQMDKDDIPFEFMRVGEAYDDVETDGCWNTDDDMPHLELTRKIEVEYN